MRRPVVLAILAIALAARAAGQISPAADLAAGAPLTGPARAILADVLVRSILVGHCREVAAFIIRESHDGIGCVLWPRRDLEFAATFHGRVPPTTVAIVHSHPAGAPPSRGDFEAARIANLPIYVVTRTEVWFVDPAGRVRNLARDRLWSTEVSNVSAPCRDVSPSLAASR